MTDTTVLLKKWDKELKALSEAFDDPFQWNIKCVEILEAVDIGARVEETLYSSKQESVVEEVPSLSDLVNQALNSNQNYKQMLDYHYEFPRFREFTEWQWELYYNNNCCDEAYPHPITTEEGKKQYEEWIKENKE